MENLLSSAGFVQSWVPSRALSFSAVQARPTSLEKDAYPCCEMPVMFATVLGLDLLLQEHSIDLRLASEIVLSDVGATLQILQLIGQEYIMTGEPHSRMEDCLASLDVDVWFSKVSARPFANSREHARKTGLWKHCRLVAQYTQLVAESLKEVSPEQAYLVGLLHEVETIPEMLADVPDAVALDGALPPFVHAALSSVAEDGSIWRYILDAAHDLSRTEFDAWMLPDGRPTGFAAV